MSLFGNKEKKTIQRLQKTVHLLQKDNAKLKKRNNQLVNLCNEKDSFFKELMADALRHGSKLAGKHMSDRKKYLNGK